jgi:hypothetical protein
MLIGLCNFPGVNEINTPPSGNLTLWRKYFQTGGDQQFRSWPSGFSQPQIRIFLIVKISTMGYSGVKFAQYHSFNPLPEKQITGSPLGMHCRA